MLKTSGGGGLCCNRNIPSPTLKSKYNRSSTPSEFGPTIGFGTSNPDRSPVSAETPKEESEELVKESGLACRMQDDGYMLVYGDGEKLKHFIKRTAATLRVAKEK